jgi:hypothetical protein
MGHPCTLLFSFFQEEIPGLLYAEICLGKGMTTSAGMWEKICRASEAVDMSIIVCDAWKWQG